MGLLLGSFLEDIHIFIVPFHVIILAGKFFQRFAIGGEIMQRLFCVNVFDFHLVNLRLKCTYLSSRLNDVKQIDVIEKTNPDYESNASNGILVPKKFR